VVVDVVDVVVEVEELDVDESAHAVVAWVSAALTWPWSPSSRLWSEVNVAWRPAMAEGEGDEGDEVPEPEAEPVPDAAGVVVAGVAVWAVVVLVVVVAVWLVSALARVALAEASDAWAEITAALSVARSSDAKVWPAATAWPTDTSTALTVPEALKLRSAWLTGVMVPTESSVDSTVPVPTRAVR
jgi:Na+-transporting methylmalonyl-CoA/oxaloacetate decarboxylase gamma subunit